MLAVQSARSALCKCHLHISCSNIRLSTRLAQCLKLSRFKLVHCLTLQGKWACQPWDYLFAIIYKLRVFLITNVPKLFIHCPCNVCPLTETKAMSIFACSELHGSLPLSLPLPLPLPGQQWPPPVWDGRDSVSFTVRPAWSRRLQSLTNMI